MGVAIPYRESARPLAVRPWVTWTTHAESDLGGFHVLATDKQGRLRFDSGPIDCAECTTGRGHTCTYDLPKHQNGRDLAIEAVHRDGSTSLFPVTGRLTPPIVPERLEPRR